MSTSAGNRPQSRKSYVGQQNSDPAEGADDPDYESDGLNPQSDDSNVQAAIPAVLQPPHALPPPPPLPVTYTPQRAKRPLEPRDTSEELRDLVYTAARHGDRDTLTRAPNFNGINQLCHILPHSMTRIQRLRLERKINAKFINVDSRHNLMPSSPNEHVFFDKFCHGFAPIERYLRQMNSFMGHFQGQCYTEVFPNEPGKFHEFMYIPLNRDGIVDVYIPDATEESGWQESRQAMEQPLAARGIIESHVNPFFMLWNLGYKIHHFMHGAHNGIPSASIWTPEQKMLCDKVYTMTQGWFDPMTEEERKECGGTLYFKPDIMEGSTRSQTAYYRAESIAGGGATTIVGDDAEEAQQDPEICVLEISSRSDGKRALKEDSDDEALDVASKKQKMISPELD